MVNAPDQPKAVYPTSPKGFSLSKYLALILLATIPLDASVISSGTVRIVGSSIGALVNFSFTGADFTIVGDASGQSYFPLITCSPCPSGVSVSAGHKITDSDGSAGWWRGSPGTVAQLRPSYLTFTGPTVLINGPGIFTAPFTLVGSLCGVISIETWNMGNRYCNGDFPLLEGSGIATFEYGLNLFPPKFIYFKSATYTFQSPDQTPELPTGITTLMAACLIAMRCLLRLKRRPLRYSHSS